MKLLTARVGYIVYNINTKSYDYPIGKIISLNIIPNEKRAGMSLLREALNYFDENEINFIKYFVSNKHLNQKIFKKFGFVSSPDEQFMRIQVQKGIEKQIDNILNSKPNEILIQYGDTD